MDSKVLAEELSALMHRLECESVMFRYLDDQREVESLLRQVAEAIHWVRVPSEPKFKEGDTVWVLNDWNAACSIPGRIVSVVGFEAAGEKQLYVVDCRLGNHTVTHMIEEQFLKPRRL